MIIPRGLFLFWAITFIILVHISVFIFLFVKPLDEEDEDDEERREDDK